jgi:hypothetical protein
MAMHFDKRENYRCAMYTLRFRCMQMFRYITLDHVTSQPVPGLQYNLFGADADSKGRVMEAVVGHTGTIHTERFISHSIDQINRVLISQEICINIG